MITIGRICFLNIRFGRTLSISGSSANLLTTEYIAKLNDFELRRRRERVLIKNPTACKINVIKASDMRNKSIVFVEDINKIVTLAETDEDLEILKNALLKFSGQKNLVSFNSFAFGPQVMKLLYVMNKPLEALSLVENPNLLQYFQHIISVSLLLDLLFKNCMYEQVIITYDSYTERVGQLTSPNILVYFFASCYKLDTKDCIEKAKEVWYSSFGHKRPTLRLKLIFSMILLNHGLCPLETQFSQNFNSLAENIKYMILAKAARFQDLFYHIRETLNSENARKFLVAEETLSFIEKEIQNSTESNLVNFFGIKEELRARKVITSTPLETFLLGNIHMVQKRVADDANFVYDGFSDRTEAEESTGKRAKRAAEGNLKIID